MEAEALEYSWDESMRTGDEINDRQHKELIHRLNLLLQSMYKGHPAEQVESTLDFLASYVVEHFTHEETVMEEVHCPLAHANKRAHAEFLVRFGAFQEDLAAQKSSPSVIAVKMLRELSDWIVRHIRTIDARMLPYVQATQPSAGVSTGAPQSP
ncbi:MAG TPA: hemerythrin family protein [Anaerolineae bacterium]